MNYPKIYMLCTKLISDMLSIHIIFPIFIHYKKILYMTKIDNLIGYKAEAIVYTNL